MPRRRLDKTAAGRIISLVKKRIPLLTLPTEDFAEMMHMNSRRLISVLRQAVLAPDRAARFSPRPPANHDAYLVRHFSSRISISLYTEGVETFRCEFVPPAE